MHHGIRHANLAAALEAHEKWDAPYLDAPDIETYVRHEQNGGRGIVLGVVLGLVFWVAVVLTVQCAADAYLPQRPVAARSIR